MNLAAILLILAFSLSLTGNTWIFVPASMVSWGAYYFYISDSIIAVNRYVPGMHPGRMASTMTYHLGPSLIILGVVYRTQLLISS